MYYFIVNPNARSGRGRKVWRRVKTRLHERGIVFQVHFTEHVGHAMEIAKMLADEGSFKTVVAMGGDGTVNEVIEGLTGHPEVIFGYIPIGSGNDFARGLGISFNWKTALDRILGEHRTAWVWPMRLTYKNTEGKVCVRRAAGSSGIGFDAAVCHGVNHSRVKPWLNQLGLGKLAYTAIAVSRMFTGPERTVRMRIDGKERRIYKKVLFVCALKGAYEGGGFKFCPDGDLREEALSVCVVSRIPRIKCLMILPLAFWGKHVQFKGVDVFKCRKLEMAISGQWPVHMDGEVPETTDRVRIETESMPVQMIC